MTTTARLSEADLRWVERMHGQAKAAEKHWTTHAEQLYRLYGGEWIAFLDGEVAFHTRDETEMEKWLEGHDETREKYLVRRVPEPDDEFAF